MKRRTLLKGAMGLPLLSLPSLNSLNVSSIRNTKVAVVGAGAFGAWTALKLAEQGAKVQVIDPWGPGNSRASSGGESRVIRSVYGPDRIYTQWVKRSFDLWHQLETSSGESVYFPTGLIWMFSAPDDYMRSSIPIANEFGFKIDELSLDETSKRYPQINLEGLKSVFYEHSAGYLLARKACQVVLERSKSLGAQTLVAAAKPLLNLQGDLKSIGLTSGEKVEADHFVFACGPWLGQLLPDVIGNKLAPTRQEIHYFGLPPDDTEHRNGKLPIWVDFGEKLFYGIPDPERRGFKVADDTRGDDIDPTKMDRTPNADSIERSQKFMAKRFPKLAGAPLVESRVCQYENSPDGQFIIDKHPTAKNVWIVGGGSGHGFKLSPAIGEFVANRILGSVQHEPFFGLKRFENRNEKKTQFETDK